MNNDEADPSVGTAIVNAEDRALRDRALRVPSCVRLLSDRASGILSRRSPRSGRPTRRCGDRDAVGEHGGDRRRRTGHCQLGSTGTCPSSRGLPRRAARQGAQRTDGGRDRRLEGEWPPRRAGMPTRRRASSGAGCHEPNSCDGSPTRERPRTEFQHAAFVSADHWTATTRAASSATVIRRLRSVSCVDRSSCSRRASEFGEVTCAPPGRRRLALAPVRSVQEVAMSTALGVPRRGGLHHDKAVGRVVEHHRVAEVREAAGRDERRRQQRAGSQPRVRVDKRPGGMRVGQKIRTSDTVQLATSGVQRPARRR